MGRWKPRPPGARLEERLEDKKMRRVFTQRISIIVKYFTPNFYSR